MRGPVLLLTLALLSAPIWASAATSKGEAGAPKQDTAAAKKPAATPAAATDKSTDDSGTGAEEPAAEGPQPEELKPQPKFVYMYEDGCTFGYSVPDDFEFQQVDSKDIVEGNLEVMRDSMNYGPAVGTVSGAKHFPSSGTAGAGRFASSDPRTEVYGHAPEGLLVRDYQKRWPAGEHWGDWNELRGDFAGGGNWYSELDHSTPRWNLDGDHFTRQGWVYGLNTIDQNAGTQESLAGHRTRDLTNLVLRNGSAEGNSWSVRLHHYNRRLDADGPIQPDDGQLYSVDVSTRIVDCVNALEVGGFAGNYKSTRALMDNKFAGFRWDGSRWVACNFELSTDGAVTRIDATQQDSTLTRSDINAEAAWDASDSLRLSAFTEGRSDDSSVSAGTRVSGFRDVGARAEWTPDCDTAVTATARHRDVDLERLEIENGNLFDFTNKFNPVPTRADLAGLRENVNSGGDLIELDARRRFNCDFSAGANWQREDYSGLPPAARLYGLATTPQYLPDHREHGSLHAAYDLGCLGNVTFRADTDYKRNSARESSYRAGQYTLSYTAPLNRVSRLELGATRQNTNISMPDAGNDFTGSGWDYSLSLSGNLSNCRRECRSCSSCPTRYRRDVDYRISADHGTSDGYSGGSMTGVALELGFSPPWRVNAWWRQFDGYLGGQNSHDAGLDIGYRLGF